VAIVFGHRTPGGGGWGMFGSRVHTEIRRPGGRVPKSTWVDNKAAQRFPFRQSVALSPDGKVSGFMSRGARTLEKWLYGNSVGQTTPTTRSCLCSRTHDRSTYRTTRTHTSTFVWPAKRE
jgi:hypothetical protein